MRNRIGMARFLIMLWPVSKNVLGDIDAMERLRENHVLRKTPVTNANSMIVKNCRIFSFIVICLPHGLRWDLISHLIHNQ